jgi:hypothetical protein
MMFAAAGSQPAETYQLYHRPKRIQNRTSQCLPVFCDECGPEQISTIFGFVVLSTYDSSHFRDIHIRHSRDTSHRGHVSS